MSSIAEWRPDPETGKPRWEARWRTPNGRSRRKVFDRKRDAQQFLVEVDRTKINGTYADPKSRLPHRSGYYETNSGTFVYIAYDRRGRALYVGVTDGLFARMESHRKRSPWWAEMQRLEWKEWRDRASALRQEAALIDSQRPPYNFVGKPGRKTIDA